MRQGQLFMEKAVEYTSRANEVMAKAHHECFSSMQKLLVDARMKSLLPMTLGVGLDREMNSQQHQHLQQKKKTMQMMNVQQQVMIVQRLVKEKYLKDTCLQTVVHRNAKIQMMKTLVYRPATTMLMLMIKA